MLDAKDLEQYVTEETLDWRGNGKAPVTGHGPIKGSWRNIDHQEHCK